MCLGTHLKHDPEVKKSAETHSNSNPTKGHFLTYILALVVLINNSIQDEGAKWMWYSIQVLTKLCF